MDGLRHQKPAGVSGRLRPGRGVHDGAKTRETGIGTPALDTIVMTKSNGALLPARELIRCVVD